MMKAKKIGLFITILFLMVSLVGCQLFEQNKEPDALFFEVFEHLRTNHYLQPDSEELWFNAIQGMINGLDDPYTTYFSQAEFEAFQNSLGESFIGIGVTVENINNQVVIRKVWPGSPAERGGLMPGDIITHVDGVDYRSKSYFDVLSVVIGEINTSVEIGISRLGAIETIFVTMVRQEIENPSVTMQVIHQDHQTIGYLKVNAFGNQTLNIFKTYLEQLENEYKITGLVIDVRDNSGGYLHAVVPMLQLFLVESSQPMFSIEAFRNGTIERDEFKGGQTSQRDYPIVTLINGFSASASEVFASSMMEHGHYPVVGTDSYGKGTMQTTMRLRHSDGDELHISTGRWFTSTDRWIDRYHSDIPTLEPTIHIEQNPYFYTYQIFLTEQEVLVYDTVSIKITNAQMILNALGYDVREDGYFDLNTQTSVKDFQLNNALTVTGDIDALTAQKLSQRIFEYKQDIVNDHQLFAAIELILND